MHRITGDVTGAVYALLLEAALAEAATFSLVWRDQLPFAATATAIRETLHPLQVRHVRRDRWPGTALIGHYASVVTYRTSPAALSTLLEPGSLFAWRAPAYPEDLSFGSARNSVCLATVAHEETGWIFSESLASAIGGRVTLVTETLDPGDEEFFRPA